MECLLDYIGIRACGNESSGSGQWIDSLPGISLESMVKTADSDQITYRALWSDVQTEAANRFYTDVVNELTKCYQLQPYCDYESLICENKAKLITAWKYLLGNQLMLFRLYTTRLNRFTTVDANKAAELRDFYESEYKSALTLAAKIMNVASCECMICGGNPETVTWLP
jgi:hypothetical protein